MSDTGKTRGALLLEDGAVGFPSLAAYARQGDGMWFNSTGIHFSVAGTEVFSIASTGPSPVGSLLLANGTAAAPSLAFSSSGNNNTGLFLKAADALGFAANGAEVGSISATGLFTLGASGGTEIHAVNGSLTATRAVTATALIPTGSTVPANGMYLSGTNVLNLATNSTSRMSISAVGAVLFKWGGGGSFGLKASDDVTLFQVTDAYVLTLGRSGATETIGMNGPVSGTKYFKCANAGDPGAVTDAIAIGSFDLSAGNATLSLRTETAVVSETVVSDATLSVQINGVTYKICLKV